MERHLAASSKSTTALEWDDYYAVFVRAYKSLVDDFDLAEAHRCILVDWEQEMVDGMVGQPEFCDAVFDLADAWTQTTEPIEYGCFLLHLLDSICDRSAPPQLKPLSQVRYSGDGLAIASVSELNK